MTLVSAFGGIRRPKSGYLMPFCPGQVTYPDLGDTRYMMRVRNGGSWILVLSSLAE